MYSEGRSVCGHVTVGFAGSSRIDRSSVCLDILRIYAAERLDLMDDLIRHAAPGLVTQPVPNPPAGNGH